MPKKSPKSLPLLPNDVEDRIIALSFPRLHQWCNMRINSGDTPDALKWSKTSVTKKISEFHGNDEYLKHKLVRIMKRGLSKPFDIRVDIMDKADPTDDFTDHDVPVNSEKVTFQPLTSRTDRARTKKKKKSKKKKKKKKRSRRKRTRRRNGSKGKRMSGGSKLPPIMEEPAGGAREPPPGRARFAHPLVKSAGWNAVSNTQWGTREERRELDDDHRTPWIFGVSKHHPYMADPQSKSCDICEKKFSTFRNRSVQCAQCHNSVCASKKKGCSSTLGNVTRCKNCAEDSFVKEVIRKIQSEESVTSGEKDKVIELIDESMESLFTELFSIDDNDLGKRAIRFNAWRTEHEKAIAKESS
jgi:hypothetical protein